MKLHRLLMLCALVALAFCICMPCAHATTTGNLVVDGDAESGLSGWSQQPTGGTPPYFPFPSVDTYTSSFYGLGATEAVGDHYFYGNPSDTVDDQEQSIDVSAYATSIDAGTASYTLSATLGWANERKGLPSIGIEFYDASGNSLTKSGVWGLNGSYVKYSLTPSGITDGGLSYATRTTEVPEGTRTIVVGAGEYPYQVVDDISLTIMY